VSRKVIEIGGPGLGDSLSYSTLPEELTRQFGHEVWLREPRAGWRNEGVRRLWERNAFVKGFVDEPQSNGFASLTGRAPRSFSNWISAMEDMHGCALSGRDCPKIYWTPRKSLDWSRKIFADPRSSSQPFPAAVFDEFVRKVAWQLNFDSAEVVVIESPYSSANGRDALPDNPRLMVSGLDEYAEAIASSRIFLAVESGGHAFASAVKGANETPHIVALFTNKQLNDRVFVFGNVSYRCTSFDGKDWHSYG
jgi:hypothetical protein